MKALHVMCLSLGLCLLGVAMLGASLIFAHNARATQANQSISQLHLLNNAPVPTFQIVTGPLSTPVPANSKGTVTVSCPNDWMLTGGGFILPNIDNGVGVLADVNESSASSTTWTVTFRNTGAEVVQAKAQAICQRPQDINVQIVSGPITTASGTGTYSAFASCPSGTKLSGGGYNFPSGGSVGNVQVFTNRASSASTWGVAVNTKGAARFNAFAYCVSMS